MSRIYQAQDALVALLAADAQFFTDTAPATPVLNGPVFAMSQRKGDIQNVVAQALQKLGAGVVVMLPLMTFEGSGSRISIGLKFAIVVTENVIANQKGATGTRKPAEAIVEKVIALVHWKPNGVGAASRAESGLFQIDKNAARIMEPIASAPGLLNYTVAVNTIVNLN